MGAAFVIHDNDKRKPAFYRMMVETKKSLVELMVQWGGVLNRDLIWFTPPRAPKDENGVDQNSHPNGRPNWPAQKKAGDSSVERDVKRLFPLVMDIHIVQNPPSNLVHWAQDVKRYAREGNISALRRLLPIAGIGPIILENASENYHAMSRDERGRVKRGVRYPILSKSSRETLTRKLQSHVGKAKAGWVTHKLPVKNVAGWITRHAMPDGSEVDLKGPNYRIVFRNTSPATKGMGADLMVEPAMAIIDRKFMKSLKAVTEYNANKFNHGH